MEKQVTASEAESHAEKKSEEDNSAGSNKS
jgi:hypothetical protein